VSEQVKVLDDTVKAADSEYEKIKIANITDLDRYDTKREADFLEMIGSIAIVQQAYAERCAEVWIEISKALGADADDVAKATG